MRVWIVLRLIKEASVNPDVMTIKITIYRLANKARLVEYLCAAAENGKEVTVLIELRARLMSRIILTGLSAWKKQGAV